jgi:hypothetical protein
MFCLTSEILVAQTDCREAFECKPRDHPTRRFGPQWWQLSGSDYRQRERDGDMLEKTCPASV